MGRHYKRKSCRATWTAEALDEAMSKVTNKELGINQASREYGIPSRTLRRHLTLGKGKGPLGRCPELGFEYEKKLVSHIQALEKVGFSPSKADVQSLAFALAEKMNLEHRFSQTKEKAGDDWFGAFMRRNKEIVLRKSEGLSLARAQGMNRKDVDDYFNVLKNILIENDLMDKPGKIYNVDETGIQINNKPGRVLATKGAKEVYTITSSDKGETVSVIACCNAEGQFLPPVLIFKGKNKKPEFSEGLPPGSDVYMNQKSSYISSDLFYKWFIEHFVPKKGTGKALLLLDGHGSHSNSIELLETAAANNVILLCFPSHTTHALQPLDRAFFKPFKTYFNQETKIWMTNHKERKLNRFYIAQLIGKAWCKAATISTGISAMRCTGVYPFNPLAIPDYFFCIDASSNESHGASVSSNRQEDIIARPSTSGLLSKEMLPISSDSPVAATANPPSGSFQQNVAPEIINHEPLSEAALEPPINDLNIRPDSPSILTHSPDELFVKLVDEPNIEPESNSFIEIFPSPTKQLPQTVDCSNSEILKTTQSTVEEKETPTKVLKEILPIPVIPQYATSRKQKTTIFTSPEFMAKKTKVKKNKQTPKEKTTKENREKLVEMTTKKKKTQDLHSSESQDDAENNNSGEQSKKKKQELQKKRKIGKNYERKTKKKRRLPSSSSESETDDIEVPSSNEESDTDENACVECLENYNLTKRSVDWIQCTKCLKWLHEDCTMYGNLCNKCGRYNVRQLNKK